MSGVCKRRIYFMFSIVFILMGLLAVRLYFIQVEGAYRYQSTYTNQHTGSLDGLGYRGTVYDRNGMAITNDQRQFIYLVEKTKLDDKALERLEETGADRVTVDSRRYAAFASEEYDEGTAVFLEENYGGYVFSTVKQFSDDQLAAHLVGYLNRLDNSGAFGLERAFDSALYSDQGLYLVVDAVGRLLPGYGVERRGSNQGGSVWTTLDMKIQEAVEVAFKKTAERGSVVVMDVETGEILASASFPSFNPNDVAAAIEEGEDELINKALQSSYPPGSVFKIVIASAALEAGIADWNTVFTCTGGEELNGIRIKCSKEEGHGVIDLREAFSQSCNCAFIQLGKAMDEAYLLEVADRFGVGAAVLGILEEESEGVLPTLGDLQGAGIGNFSIGQGRLEMTCLQVCRMTAVIARGGRMPAVQLVSAASDGEEKLLYEFSRDGMNWSQAGEDEAIETIAGANDEENSDKGSNGALREEKNDGEAALSRLKEGQVISEATAKKVQRLMKQTVLTGTGKRIQYDAAGKTGSAQSSQSGEKVVHGWFTGFFPASDPKYAVTILVEKGGGASPAVTIFNDIAAALDCPEKPVLPTVPKQELSDFFQQLFQTDDRKRYSDGESENEIEASRQN